uniref:40S ribosomal protein S11 n=1 Tax=Steinernema glaseri TaxID=37863 RepID=A0A1I8ADV5_9BILA
MINTTSISTDLHGHCITSPSEAEDPEKTVFDRPFKNNRVESNTRHKKFKTSKGATVGTGQDRKYSRFWHLTNQTIFLMSNYEDFLVYGVLRFTSSRETCVCAGALLTLDVKEITMVKGKLAKRIWPLPRISDFSSHDCSQAAAREGLTNRECETSTHGYI